MKWQRRSPDSIQAGEHVISRAKVQGREVYTLWRQNEAVGYADTAAMAKQMADDEAAKERRA